jgi:hypothetical protein
MADPPRYQFSVASLLLVTTVAAVVMGLLAWLKIPFWNPVVPGLVGGYLLFLGTWFVIRGPRLLCDYRDLRRRRASLKLKRLTLAEEVRAAKAEAEQRTQRAKDGGSQPGG